MLKIVAIIIGVFIVFFIYSQLKGRKYKKTISQSQYLLLGERFPKLTHLEKLEIMKTHIPTKIRWQVQNEPYYNNDEECFKRVEHLMESTGVFRIISYSTKEERLNKLDSHGEGIESPPSTSAKSGETRQAGDIIIDATKEKDNEEIRKNWTKFLETIEGTTDYKELSSIMNNFFIPDQISVSNFKGNYAVIADIYYTMSPWHRSSIPLPTPSAKRFDTIDRPLGYPLWFFAAYPDIAKWFTDIADNKDDINSHLKLVSKIIGRTDLSNNESLFESICVDSKTDKLNLFFLRKLVDYYTSNINSKLECVDDL